MRTESKTGQIDNFMDEVEENKLESMEDLASGGHVSDNMLD